ncbi:restriction modification system DNA specificity domain protein [Paenibacillus sp. JDR-2]|nr:restriction modification system DNA specificity domain protein [Paenibacillus sp. JDR-2]
MPIEDQPYEVPGNWVWVKLGSLAYLTDFVANGSFQSLRENVEVSDDTDYALYVRLTDLRLGLGHEGQKYVDETSYKFLSKSSLTGGEILIANIGANVGEVFVMPNVDLLATIAPNMIVLRCNHYVENIFLNYFLSSPQGKKLLGTIITGTGQPKINKTGLKTISVALPPLNEQKRIADKVERLLDKINQAKQLIEEAKATFELRQAAILDKAFRGELTKKWRGEHSNQISTVRSISEDINPNEIPFLLPAGWNWVRLKDLGTLERGKSKHRPRNDPKLFGGEYPFIQTGDVANAGDYIESYNQTLSEFGLLQSKLFPEGTVCITIAANIADTALLKFPCCFPDSVVGFIPKDAYISSLYLHYYMRTIKSNLEHYAPATAQKNINLKVLQEILVPVPPKTEHDEILHMINLLMQKDEEAQTIMNVASDLEILKQSVLSKAFQGNLGTNESSENLIFN